MLLKNLAVLVVVVTINRISSECRDKYFTKFCKNFSEFDPIKDHSFWKHVVIGSEKSLSTELIKFDPIDLYKFNEMESLTVINHINKINYRWFDEEKCKTLNLESLTFMGNKIKELTNLPNSMKVRYVNFANNSIETVQFGSQSIKILILSYNKIESIDVHSLNELDKLKSLVLDNNQIGHIDNGALPKNLQYLNLEGNNIVFIHKEAFEHLKKLKTLILKNNKIKKVPEFNHLTSLKLLDLSMNKIYDMQGHLFGAALEGLDLSHNELGANSFLPSLLDSRYRKNQTLRLNLSFNELLQVNTRFVDFGNHSMFWFGNPFDCDKWNDQESYLNEHQDECDINLFTNGSLPYCINYLFGINLEVDTLDRQKEIVNFQSALSSHGPVVNCFKKSIYYSNIVNCKI